MCILICRMTRLLLYRLLDQPLYLKALVGLGGNILIAHRVLVPVVQPYSNLLRI